MHLGARGGAQPFIEPIVRPRLYPQDLLGWPALEDQRELSTVPRLRRLVAGARGARGGREGAFEGAARPDVMMSMPSKPYSRLGQVHESALMCFGVPLTSLKIILDGRGQFKKQLGRLRDVLMQVGLQFPL